MGSGPFLDAASYECKTSEMEHRPKRLVENIAWFMTLALAVLVIVLSKNNAPAPLQNALVVLDFLFAFPLIVIALKRDWRKLCGEDQPR